MCIVRLKWIFFSPSGPNELDFGIFFENLTPSPSKSVNSKNDTDEMTSLKGGWANLSPALAASSSPPASAGHTVQVEHFESTDGHYQEARH